MVRMAALLWVGWLLTNCVVLRCDVGMLDAFCKEWVGVNRPGVRLEGFCVRLRWMDACVGEMVAVVRASCFCATAIRMRKEEVGMK